MMVDGPHRPDVRFRDTTNFGGAADMARDGDGIDDAELLDGEVEEFK